MYTYIISAKGYKAMPVKSDLLIDALQKEINSRCRLIHPDCSDLVWRYGSVDFVNPKVMLPSDYCETLPALIRLTW